MTASIESSSEGPVVAINLSLNKLPWYAQVGVFVAAVGGGGRLLLVILRRQDDGRHRRARGTARHDQPANRARSQHGEAVAGSVAKSNRSKRSSIVCVRSFPKNRT